MNVVSGFGAQVKSLTKSNESVHSVDVYFVVYAHLTLDIV